MGKGRISLIGWRGIPGQYFLVFLVFGVEYCYETWDGTVVHDIRRTAVYRPGKALNMAKTYCSLVKSDKEDKPAKECYQPQLLEV